MYGHKNCPLFENVCNKLIVLFYKQTMARKRCNDNFPSGLATNFKYFICRLSVEGICQKNWRQCNVFAFDVSIACDSSWDSEIQILPWIINFTDLTSQPEQNYVTFQEIRFLQITVFCQF